MHSVLLSAEYLPAAQSTQLAATALEYVPAAQSMQAAVPSLGVYLPETQLLQPVFVPDQPAGHKQYEMLALRDKEYDFAGHQMQSVLLSVEYLPAAQSLQVFMDPFKTTENCPGAQNMHSPDPALCLYLPATQLVQSPVTPDQPVRFAAHGRQWVDAATECEYSPTSQAVHAIDPLWALYLPTTQPLQSPCVPVQPAWHVHAADASEEKELAGQSTQLVSPVCGLYFPGAHATHSLPFAPSHPALQTQAVMTVLPTGEVEFAGQSMHIIR